MNSDIPFMSNSDSLQTFLKYLSEVLGWLYFLAWSASFYGQVIENYRRHKVTGLNFDYIVYNLVGFSGYTTYTIWGYIDTNLGTGKITLQDIFFAAHGLLLTICFFSYQYKNSSISNNICFSFSDKSFLSNISSAIAFILSIYIPNLL